jgi:hypothetical protein
MAALAGPASARTSTPLKPTSLHHPGEVSAATREAALKAWLDAVYA